MLLPGWEREGAARPWWRAGQPGLRAAEGEAELRGAVRAQAEPGLVKIGDSGIVFLVLTLTAFVPGACSSPDRARGRGEQFRSRHGLGEGNKNRISSYYQPHRIFITPAPVL
jgi:hypothetical protein